MILSIPAVQTKLGKKATEIINTDYKTNITVGKVGLQLNGDVELKEILIRDHKNDTLISIGELNTSIISINNLLNNKLNFGDIDIQHLLFNLKTYQGEEDTNLDVFVAKFDDDNPQLEPSGFLFSSSDVSIEDGIFKLTNENLETPEVFEFSNLEANTTNFLIDGKNVSARINTFSFQDSRGVEVENLMANFEYTVTHMLFDNLDIKTKASELKGDLRFNYNREDLKEFTSKVQVEASFKDSEISLTELNAFFDEFGVNQRAKLNADLSGTLNDLRAKNLNVSTTRNTKILGDITFKNLFDPNGEFQLSGSFTNLSSNYNDLTALLPNLLGKSIPSVLSKVGNFKIKGTSFISSEQIHADLNINTDIGLMESNLVLTELNSIDNAKYVGNVVFDEFDIGKVINDSLVKNTSVNLDVDGKGFTLENLQTKIKGEVFSLDYNGYTYRDIDVSGDLGNKVFNGQLVSNDSNAKLTFNGLADISQDIKKFDFTANVDYVNLNTLNFVIRDKVSEFSGDINLKASGSNYDNAVGLVNIKNTIYKNQDGHYTFEDFDIKSMFNQKNERVLTINSPDIINGQVTGQFKVKDVISLVENSLGSIYTNYSPNVVDEGQYFDFKFNIYSKIATLFYKDLFLGKNTFIEGRIETDEKGFKLKFNSPEIKFQDYFANKINIQIDNNNTVYNTYIDIDTLSAGLYNASDFNLINVTKRDTLFVKSQFKGGKGNADNYDLNMFYTIDRANKSVVGFKKSNILLKGNQWYLNSKKDSLNKVAFDRDFNSFDIKPITFSQANESIQLYGTINGANTKNLNVNFNNVELAKITPEIDSLSLKGIVNGKLEVLQTEGVYLPKSDLSITDLNVNRYNLGDLTAKVTGNNSITDYAVDIELLNNNVKSLTATGSLNVDDKNSSINLDVTLEDLLLNPLNPFGSDVITNIRGLASGNAKVTGNLKKPDINGELTIDDAGLSIPYLNVDYAFESGSKVSLRQQRFVFNNAELTDSKYLTKGNLNGYIEHHNFSDWKLGLELSSSRLLILDTEDSLDALYYGTGFVSGTAEIKGLTDQLVIEMENGRTESGTVFNIPIKDTENFGDNSYIHFITPEEKEAKVKGEIANQFEDIKGLELKLDLEVNRNAEISILLDESNTIKGNGEGFLGFFINTNGTFNMWGDFTVYEGVYNFRYRGLAQKRFEVEQGGIIEWNGDPFDADMNIKAIYKINANPSVLLDNPINQRIPVELEIDLNGNLSRLDPTFNFEFPTASSTVKSELDYRLSSKDERDNQALILLATGGFSRGTSGLNLSGTISERLSGIVNNLFGSENDNFNLGLDVELGQDTPDVQTNNRVGLTLQTKINERILVNGKVGVPFGSNNTATQTVISGDVQVDFLLNEDGSLKAKVFNKENTIRNFGEEIGYQQGVGISYNVEFDDFKELIQKVFAGKKKKVKKEESKEKEVEANKDENLPDFITMKKKKSN